MKLNLIRFLVSVVALSAIAGSVAEAQIQCSEKAIGRLVRNVTKAYNKLGSVQRTLTRYEDARIKSVINYDNRETAYENDRFEYISDLTRIQTIIECGFTTASTCLSLATIGSCLTGAANTQCLVYFNEVKDTLVNFDNRLHKLHMQEAEKMARYDSKINRQQLKVNTAQVAVTNAESALAQCQ